MRKFPKSIILFLLLLIPFAMFSQKKKAILIGIDGLQFEKIDETKTPNFDKLIIKKGFTGGIAGTQSEQKTVSGPSWMSILTGVWTDQHHIIGNDKDKLSDAPSVFRMIKEHSDNIYISSVSTWKNINIFLKDDLYYTNFSAQGGTDMSSTELVIDQIVDYDADFSFVHLDDVDHAGHAYGFGKNYTKTVEYIDSLLGNILNAVEERHRRFHEDWLVIIVSDHGRDNEGFSHGKQEVNQKTTFIGMNKDGNDYFQQIDNNKVIRNIKDLETMLPITAIVPTLLKHFDVPIKTEWNLDAKPLVD